MTSIYSYPQHYSNVDGSHQSSNGYMNANASYQPTVAGSNGYYQGSYVAAPPVYHQPAPVMNAHQQMYAPAPIITAPAANPYAQSYGYNNGANYYQVPQQQAQPQVQQQPQRQEEQAVTGGVSSVLDYDLHIMTKFSTYLAFRLFGRNDVENAKFISSLKSVLSATRLPLSSLILANYYMLQKYELDPTSFNNSSDDLVYQNVVLSLVLANKANDDNTFTNKSWSDATGLNVKLINVMEANWLSLIDWKLHDTDMERYDELMLQFNKYAESHKVQQQFSRSVREPVSPILSNGSSQFSPRDSSPSRFSNYTSNNWYGDYQTSSNITTPYNSYNSFEPRYKNYYPSHQKAYSYQEPEYCLRTGSYQKMMCCPCHYCSTPSRTVDWSYNMAAAC